MDLSRRLRLVPAATLCAGVVVASTLQAPTSVRSVPDFAAARAIELTAFDVITPWLSVFNNTVNNVVGLITGPIEPPLPVAQQIIANQLLYLSELPDINIIASQAAGNVSAAIAAPVSRDLFSMDIPHALGFVALEAALAKLPEFVTVPAIVTPLISFTGSFLSGALIGLIGPILGPALAIAKTVENITAALTAPVPDIPTALSEAINVVPNVLDAFLNGGPVLAATPLVSLIGTLVGLKIPAVTTVGIAMGGLLSPGGSLFNTADMDVVIDLTPPEPPVNLQLKGVPAGTLGSLLALPRSFARALGWIGFGNPLRPGIPVPGGDVPGGVTPANGTRAATAVVSRPGSRPSPAATAAQTPHRPAAGSRAARR